MQTARIGGVVFRTFEGLAFLPATAALRIISEPPISKMPGSSEVLFGIALVDGVALPVVAIGENHGALLVASRDGERVGLVGLRIVQTGRLEVDGVQVLYDGQQIRAFDLSAVFARLRGARWAMERPSSPVSTRGFGQTDPS